jgi:hypothetical protein
MEDIREPQAIAELNKKKPRPNLTAVLQVGGFLTFVSGIGVAATSTSTLPIVFSSFVSVGGFLTTIVGCIKDWSSIIKFCWPISNLDNLNRQIKEKEDKVRNKLSCCLEEARQMKNSKIKIDVSHLITICKAVKLLGQETKIASEIKKELVEIFKNNTDLLDVELLKDVIPRDVELKARQEIERRNREVIHLNKPQGQTLLDSVELSNS